MDTVDEVSELAGLNSLFASARPGTPTEELAQLRNVMRRRKDTRCTRTDPHDCP